MSQNQNPSPPATPATPAAQAAQAPQAPQPGEITIKAEDAVAMGRFANIAQVAMSPESFVIDFAYAHNQSGFLLARILVSPGHAKRFHAALGQTIAQFEGRYGMIPITPPGR